MGCFRPACAHTNTHRNTKALKTGSPVWTLPAGIKGHAFQLYPPSWAKYIGLWPWWQSPRGCSQVTAGLQPLVLKPLWNCARFAPGTQAKVGKCYFIVNINTYFPFVSILHHRHWCTLHPFKRGFALLFYNKFSSKCTRDIISNWINHGIYVSMYPATAL